MGFIIFAVALVVKQKQAFRFRWNLDQGNWIAIKTTGAMLFVILSVLYLSKNRRLLQN